MYMICSRTVSGIEFFITCNLYMNNHTNTTPRRNVNYRTICTHHSTPSNIFLVHWCARLPTQQQQENPRIRKYIPHPAPPTMSEQFPPPQLAYIIMYILHIIGTQMSSYTHA